jgi:hypothetical protein
LTALIAATAAYAAFSNKYNGSKLNFAPKVAGSTAHPVAVGETEVLKAANTTNGDRAAPLTDIKVTVYGIRGNGGKLPKCTDSQIEANKTLYDKACPKGSLIAQGPVHSLLGPSNDPSSSPSVATACNPFLHVYNGGAKTQVFFFTTDSQHQCGNLKTGATAPYDGHICYKGKNMIVNVPLPPDISNKVANIPGLYGSLISETLVYAKTVKDAKGKALHYQYSIACGKGGKRPYSIQFTDQTYSGGTETQKVTGKDKC